MFPLVGSLCRESMLWLGGMDLNIPTPRRHVSATPAQERQRNERGGAKRLMHDRPGDRQCHGRCADEGEAKIGAADSMRSASRRPTASACASKCSTDRPIS